MEEMNLIRFAIVPLPLRGGPGSESSDSDSGSDSDSEEKSIFLGRDRKKINISREEDLGKADYAFWPLYLRKRTKAKGAQALAKTLPFFIEIDYQEYPRRYSWICLEFHERIKNRGGTSAGRGGDSHRAPAPPGKAYWRDRLRLESIWI